MRGRNAALGKFVGTKLKATGQNLADGAWHTITCTKTDSQVSLFVDGVLKVQHNVAVGSVDNTVDLSMGAKATLWDDMYTGDMDEVSYTIG